MIVKMLCDEYTVFSESVHKGLLPKGLAEQARPLPGGCNHSAVAKQDKVTKSAV
jgi:hypothetical protein